MLECCSQWYSKVFSIESRRAIDALLLCVNTHLLVSALLPIFPRYNTNLFHFWYTLGSAPATIAIFRLTLKFTLFSLLRPHLSNPFFPIFPWIPFQMFRDHAKIDIWDVELYKQVDFVSGKNSVVDVIRKRKSYAGEMFSSELRITDVI